MSERWQFQIRIRLEDAAAEAARNDPAAPELAPLPEILARHDAALVCQYDAFAGYVAEAERQGVDGFPLYAWTRATIEHPAKKAKYLRAFTLHVARAEVYPREKADSLQTDLEPLVGGPLVAAMSRHDTNPANNPQIPNRFRSRGAPPRFGRGRGTTR